MIQVSDGSSRGHKRRLYPRYSLNGDPGGFAGGLDLENERKSRP